MSNMTPAQLSALEEAATIFASGAAHNKRLGRTCFAHEQQKRAEKLREIIEQFNVKGE